MNKSRLFKIILCGLQQRTLLRCLHTTKGKKLSLHRRHGNFAACCQFTNHQHKYYSASTIPKPCQVSTSKSGKTLQLTFQDKTQSNFHSIWLRHNCHCEECKQHDSGQKTLHIVNISPDVTIETAEITGNTLDVRWSCGHRGSLPVSFLQDNSYDQRALHQRAEGVKLDKECTAKEVPTMTYKDLTSSQENVLKWLRLINTYGFCLLTGVPLRDKMVAEVAKLIEFDRPQLTIYGETFDVVSTPQPINIAYTNVALDLHMDLIYYESPPGLQLLHAIRFDECVAGGESVFLDVFRVAEDFRSQFPELFETLVQVPATFQKIHYSREKPVHLTYQRPHIVLNKDNEIVCINWAPAFEGSLAVPEADVERYYVAYQKFAQALSDSPHRLERQLQEGDLAIFNNRRILHGRNAFELNDGVRHLQGCYVNIDHFKSKLQVLNNTMGDRRPVKRVGNQDMA